MSNRPNMYLDTPDALSLLFSRLQLTAEVYVNGDFCGAWAVDTSGSRRIPFHLIGRGQAWLHMEGQLERCLSAGDLIVFPHDSRHILANSSDVPSEEVVNADVHEDGGPVTRLICGFFEFKNKAVWPLLDALAPVIVLDLSDMSEMPMARSLIDLIVAELKLVQPGHYAAVNHLAVLLFIQVIREQIQSGKVESGLLAALFDKHIGRALNAIHQYPEKRWTLELLAQESALGRSSFAQKFNALVGEPAMQYLTAWRMQEATHLLRHSNESLINIAEKCGYESEAGFRKAYKNITGQTPGKIRRAMN